MRMSLAKHIRQVISSGEDLVIEHDSSEVAKLSLTVPNFGTTHKRMLVTDAQNGWAELLSIVSMLGTTSSSSRRRSDRSRPVCTSIAQRSRIASTGVA